MKDFSFTDILYLSESIRQGLPHISTMDHKQLGSLLKTGKIHFDNVTEKTDGMTHQMGYDEHGFYTQSSGSGAEKMRYPGAFHERAQRRAKETGKSYHPAAPNAFAHLHDVLSKNEGLQNHLKDQFKKHGETKIRGEAFYKPISVPSEKKKGEIKFVGTSYDPSHMGSVGKYVIHSKLPENHHVDTEHFKKHLSTPELNFDDDKIHTKIKPLDVSYEKKLHSRIDHKLLDTRTTNSNRTAKNAQNANVNDLKDVLSNRIDRHVRLHKISPKWGSGTEGLVVHPTLHNQEAPRFKVTSDAFRSYKKEHKGLREEDESLLITEGGNIEIGGVHAQRLDTSTPEKRKQTMHDVHGLMVNLHHSFKQEHGEDLFTKKDRNHHIYVGSTQHLFNPKISDKEFAKHKPSMGDVDVQYNIKHKANLEQHLHHGKTLGPYTVHGTKKSGTELHALMRHNKTGEVHQFDFEGVPEGDEALHNERRSSSWHDIKHGFSGMHHKILLNAAGGEKYKLGGNGITSREDGHIVHGKEAAHALFGPKGDHNKLHSFVDVADQIKQHKTPEEKAAILHKVEMTVANKKGDHNHMLGYLKKHFNKLNEQETITEEEFPQFQVLLVESKEDGAHASIVPLVGFSPISHMGHAEDLGKTLTHLPGEHHVGISSKNSISTISNQTRAKIFRKQIHKIEPTSNVHTHISDSAGATIAKVFHSMPKDKKKHLHILVGHDRASMAENLKRSLESGKIKEMGKHNWDSISLHFPEGNRAGGYSGTKMRTAAASGDKEEFHRHIGLEKEESNKLLKKVQKAIKSKEIKVKR